MTKCTIINCPDDRVGGGIWYKPHRDIAYRTEPILSTRIIQGIKSNPDNHDIIGHIKRVNLAILYESAPNTPAYLYHQASLDNYLRGGEHG